MKIGPVNPMAVVSAMPDVRDRGKPEAKAERVHRPAHQLSADVAEAGTPPRRCA